MLVAGTAVIARWGVNAESLGAHDAGLRFLAAAAVCALALWPYT